MCLDLKPAPVRHLETRPSSSRPKIFADDPRIAENEKAKPTTTFPTTVSQVMAFFRSTGTKKGDKSRGVWIPEDVGDPAPKNSLLDEATNTADKNDAPGGLKRHGPPDG
jgi:hypothetical protein